MLRQRLLGFAVMLTTLALGANYTRARETTNAFSGDAQTANMIFVGTVESQTCRSTETGSMIFTDVVFSDVEVVSATESALQRDASRVTLTLPGGTIGDVTVSVSTSVRVETGRRYLLFAPDDGRVYASPIVGGAQGLFEVVRDRMTSEEFVLTAGGRAVLGFDAGRLTASDFTVLAIEGGRLVPDPAERERTTSAGAPVSADGTPARASTIEKTDAASARPLSLRAFVDQIREVESKRPATRAAVRRGDEGQMPATGDGRMATELPKRLPPHAQTASASRGAGPDSHTPLIPRAGSDKVQDDPEATGHQLLFIVMEQYPADWAENGIANDCMWTWNQSRDAFRYVDDDGSFGHNGVNEFCGYPTDEDLRNLYGIDGWGSLPRGSFTITYTQRDFIIESDVLLDPNEPWTDDPFLPINNRFFVYREQLMRSTGAAWGAKKGSSSDRLTVMHTNNFVVEDGWGLHAADAQLIRAIYGTNDADGAPVDVGVESYFCYDGDDPDSGGPRGTSLYPGDAIEFGQFGGPVLTVENMSRVAVRNMNVRFFLSTDKIITEDDYQMGSDWFWAEFPAEGVNVSGYPMTIPNVPPGIYYAGAILTVNGFESDSYPWNNATPFSDTIEVLRRFAPAVERITEVDRGSRSYKLKLGGTTLKPGMKVYIGSEGMEWTNTRFKRETLFVLRGGEALRRQFPVGVEVPIRLVNPDGGESTFTFVR